MTRVSGRPPTGTGSVNEAAVDAHGRLYVRADAESDMNAAMGHDVAFLFQSTVATGGTDIEAFYIKNNGADIHLNRIVVSVAADAVITIGRQTSGTAAGTTITGKNGKIGRPIMADVTALGNAAVTGSIAGDTMIQHSLLAGVKTEFELNDLILPDTEAIYVTCSANTTCYIDSFVFREA